MSKRQNMNTDKAMSILDSMQKLNGKLPIEGIRDVLKKENCISIPSMEEQELEVTRGFIRVYRERLVKSGDIQMDFVSLSETLTEADGTIKKQNYFKRICEQTEEEAYQTLTSQRKTCKGETDKFYRYLNAFVERFGNQFQMKLHFDLPRKLA